VTASAPKQAARGPAHVPDRDTGQTPAELRKSRAKLARAHARQVAQALTTPDQPVPPANGIVGSDGASSRKI